MNQGWLILQSCGNKRRIKQTQKISAASASHCLCLWKSTSDYSCVKLLLFLSRLPYIILPLPLDVASMKRTDLFYVELFFGSPHRAVAESELFLTGVLICIYYYYKNIFFYKFNGDIWKLIHKLVVKCYILTKYCNNLRKKID